VTAALARIVFVLGKGGVGRSTVATALGAALASRGERVLVLEWTVTESIAPWFGLPEVDVEPREVAPGLFVANYRLDWALRAYFVDHLGLRRFHRHVIDGAYVRRLIEAAPGIAELLFLGQLWWLSTLAAEEAGLRFDRIVVDAPATGHGVSILKLPATLSTLGATGLLALEADRVVTMMGDASWTSAWIVALPEELAFEETLELVPQVTRDLGRRPQLAIVNRSVVRAGTFERPGDDLEALGARLSPASRDALATVLVELRGRARRERELREALEGATEHETISLEERLLSTTSTSPREVAMALARAIEASGVLGGRT
jgi:anion-transporting  ArsA/GET3 family ATPase